MKVPEQDVYTDFGDGAFIASVKPASPAAVEMVLNATEDGFDGRSNWVWVRLATGELVLGVFPQGATYEEVSNMDEV